MEMKSGFLRYRICAVSVFVFRRIYMRVFPTCIFAFAVILCLCLTASNNLNGEITDVLESGFACNGAGDKSDICEVSNTDNSPVLSTGRTYKPVERLKGDTQSFEGDNQGENCDEYNSCSDRFGFEAIRALHHQLDDDANGNVDIVESDEFLRDELQYENGYERQKGFHGNDKHISVDELWKAWKQSEVHNWTVEETVQWLIQVVELPQYVKVFEENFVDGTALPRIAINNVAFVNNVLGIKDPIHKQKLSLKAMDIVLFGIPRHRNYVKDILLILSLLIATVGCWFAYTQHKSGQMHLRKMMKDMESLQKAEEALQLLQYELDKARQEQISVTMEMQNLERKLLDESKSSWSTEDIHCADGDNQKTVQQLQEEILFLRQEMQQSEGISWKPPTILQYWLQLTHEMELKHHNTKKVAAEKQLTEAKEECEKLRKKRSTLLGTFRIAHGNTIDDVDGWIVKARNALSDVTKDLQERLHRWKEIEKLCGFSIVRNAGLLQLEKLLQRSVANGSGLIHSISSASIPSIASPSSLGSIHHTSKANFTDGNHSPSSSESAIDASCHSHHYEELDTDNECNESELGDIKELDDLSSVSEQCKPSFKIGESYINRGHMVKSYSHDNQPATPPREVLSLSRSESSLEFSNNLKDGGSSMGKRSTTSQNLNPLLSTQFSSSSSFQGHDETLKEKKSRSFLTKLKKRKN